MSPPLILLIDDDKAIIEAMEAILEMENFEVIHAYEGKGGLRSALTHKPDLILLDYMLPDMNGKEITLALRDNDETKDIPILLVSAAREARQIASDLSINGFIEKPFDLSDLIETVRHHLS